MVRPLVLAAVLAAGPAAAQTDPGDRGPRIQLDLPGGTVAVDCGRTSISDCAAAIRPLVELATEAAAAAPPPAPAAGSGPAPGPAAPGGPGASASDGAGAGAIRPPEDAGGG